jgi:hypothetical protein
MTTTERIANAIKHILEEDRRADRERIAELERDAAHMQLRVDLALCGDNELHATIDDLNRQLDEAHKENARLVLERPYPPEAYRINRDLSHPQAGKLLVVQLDRYDVDNLRDEYDVSTTKSQWVGWLEGQGNPDDTQGRTSETRAPFNEKLPAPFVKTECPSTAWSRRRRGRRGRPQTAPVVEEQGPWVIRTAQGRYESRNKWRLARDPDGALQFQTSETAEQHIASFKPDEWDAHQKPFQVMTVDEARAIEAKRNG